MSQPPPVMPIAATEIREAISREDVFGHEMRVGSVLRSTPFMEVDHRGTYRDRVTKKPTQFGFRCSLVRQNSRLELAVECQTLSPEMPIVVSGTVRSLAEAFHNLIDARVGLADVGFAGGTPQQNSVTLQSLGASQFYPKSRFAGKSVLRIKPARQEGAREGTPGDDIHDKWAQALSSATELAEMACRLPAGGDPLRRVSAVLPIVVVPNEALWIAHYSADGTLGKDPEQVESCDLYVSHGIQATPTQTFTFSHLHFFTLKGLASFLTKMAKGDPLWDCLFTDATREI